MQAKVRRRLGKKQHDERWRAAGALRCCRERLLDPTAEGTCLVKLTQPVVLLERLVVQISGQAQGRGGLEGVIGGKVEVRFWTEVDVRG